MPLQLGFTTSSCNSVCRLRQSLYGLKQGPRAWIEKTQKTLQLYGFQQSKYDLSLEFRRTSHGITLLLVNVDDIIINGTNSDSILQL